MSKCQRSLVTKEKEKKKKLVKNKKNVYIKIT